MTPALPAIRRAIHAATGRHPDGNPLPVGGGCIHQSFVLGSFFVKINQPSFLAMFEAEADGLRALAATRTIRVPEPLTTGADQSAAFLVLERLDLAPGGDQARLGEQLAALHHHTATRHGWHRDNFIGSTPQPNPPTDDWPAFFRDHRLGHLFQLLARDGRPVDGAAELLERVPALLAGADPAPALLHGDLWGGNAGFLRDGTPVVFDPAAYHGHHEADLAMTTLFGGFGPRFYQAYHAVIPPAPGHQLRRDLYNLYHILNHALLFGGGYHQQACRLAQRLAASVEYPPAPQEPR